MEVKCPRCRFRFEMPLAPGVTTLQCFCPRCGQPFSYDLGQAQSPEDEAAGVKAPTTEEGMVPPPIPKERDGKRGPQENNAKVGERQDAQRETARSGMAEHWQGAFGTPPRQGEPPRQGVAMPVKEKKHGCLHRFLVMVVSCLAIIFFAVRYCNSERHYTAHDVNVSDGTHHQRGQESVSDAPDDDDEEADMIAAETSSAEEEQLPQWVEGSWHADTEYGGIDVTISGNTITETDGDETSKGTFHYRGNTLYCDFGDGQTFEYRLDPDKHRIDAGQGIYMSKTR